MNKDNQIEPQSVRELSPLLMEKPALQKWSEDEENYDTFKRLMNIIADEEPLEWVKIYRDIIKMYTAPKYAKKEPKGKVADNITVNNTQINKLDHVAEITDSSWRKQSDFQQYEEVKK